MSDRRAGPRADGQAAAQALVYPFRAGGARPFLVLAGLLALFPLTFPIVFGYGLAAVRASSADPSAPPPPFRVSRAAAWSGLKAAAGLAVLSAPFAAGAGVVATALAAAHRVPPTGLPVLDQVVAALLAAAVVAFPWGAVVLLVLLPNLAGFARGDRLRDLVDPGRAGRTVRRRFMAWNLAGAACVTAWALAVASLSICGVGLLAGAAYAILVTAHAAASIEAEG